jgi:hypothetical protein
MPNKKPIQVPFDTNGNQLSYAGRYAPTSAIKMVDNYEFDGVLTFESMRRGRSACTAYFITDKGMRVSVFLSDFVALMKHVHGGRVTGRFTWHKKGANIGCYLIGAEAGDEDELED